MKMAEIIPKDNYVLYIEAEDGKSGFFDVKPYLGSEVLSALKDYAEFERIHNGKYFIEWDCGADLSETLFRRDGKLYQRDALHKTLRQTTADVPPLRAHR